MSRSVEIMMEEHRYIERMLKVVRAICTKIMSGADIDYSDFEEVMDFVRKYADEHHHGKEEKFLFKEMQEHLGKIGENLVTHGMLVEHDYGRLYMLELRAALERVKAGDEESKLDVIANAISYTHLLERHIAKEDEIVYTYGAKYLPQEVIYEVDRLTEEFEEKTKEAGIQMKYIDLLKRLENKYICQ